MPQSDTETLIGRAFPPGRSVAVPAQLRRQGDALTFLDGTGAEWFSLPVYHTRRDAPLGTLPRKLTCDDGTVFETEDLAGFDTMFGKGNGHALHASERFSPRLVGVIVACLLGMFVIWRFGLPVLVSVAIWATPEPMLQQMDTGTIKTLDTLVLAESQLPDARKREIEGMFADIVAQIPPEDLPRETLLFRGEKARSSDLVPPIGPNAFALPGGTVVVTDALAEMLEDDPDALAGVLAHELTHVTEQHGLRALYRSLALYAVVGLLAGDTGPILEEALLEGNVLLSLSKSRETEREADAGAVALMLEAGYDPEGLARFFDELVDMAGDGGSWASTHPGSRERAATIRDLAR